MSEAENAEANNSGLQKMFDSSIQQELNSFKLALASQLRMTVKDMAEDVSDLTDAEKAELYLELFDEMVQKLKRNGVIIEVN